MAHCRLTSLARCFHGRYRARITGFAPAAKTHTVCYCEDGVVEKLELSKEEWRLDEADEAGGADGADIAADVAAAERALLLLRAIVPALTRAAPRQLHALAADAALGGSAAALLSSSRPEVRSRCKPP